ncbi:hypothetical protein BVX99_01000, partial [bacterium F16]
MKPILWEFRKLRIATLIATVIAAAYVLFNPTILYWHNDYIWLFCSLHVGLITYLASSNQSPEALFLYSRGISRNRIWSAKVLATALSIAVTWGLALILMVSGARQSIQDAFLNPEAVLFPFEEGRFIWCILLIYGFFFAVFHFLWVRDRVSSSIWNMCWMAIAAVAVVYGFHITHDAFGIWTAPCVLGFMVSLLIASRYVHRCIEINQRNQSLEYTGTEEAASWIDAAFVSILLGAATAGNLCTMSNRYGSYNMFDHGFSILLGAIAIWLLATLLIALLAKKRCLKFGMLLAGGVVLFNGFFLAQIKRESGAGWARPSWAELRNLSPAETTYVFRPAFPGATPLWLNGKNIGPLPQSISGTEMSAILARSKEEMLEANGWTPLSIPTPTGPGTSNRREYDIKTVTIQCKLTQQGKPLGIRYTGVSMSIDAEKTHRTIAIGLDNTAGHGDLDYAKKHPSFDDMIRFAQVNNYEVSEEWIAQLVRLNINKWYFLETYLLCRDDALKTLLTKVVQRRFGLRESDSLEMFVNNPLFQNGYHSNTGLEAEYIVRYSDELGTLCAEVNDIDTMLETMTAAFNRPPPLHNEVDRHFDFCLDLLPNLVAQLKALSPKDLATYRERLDELALAICKRDDDELFVKSCGLPSALLEEYCQRRFIASGEWIWSQDSYEEGSIRPKDYGREEAKLSNFVDERIPFSVNKWWLFLVKADTPRGRDLYQTYRADVMTAAHYLLAKFAVHRSQGSVTKKVPCPRGIFSDVLFFDHHLGKNSTANEFLPVFCEKLLAARQTAEMVELFRYLKPMGKSLNHELLYPFLNSYITMEDYPRAEYIVKAFQFCDREKQVQLLEFARQHANNAPEPNKKLPEDIKR